MKIILRVLNGIWVTIGVFLLIDGIAGAIAHGPRKYWEGIKKSFMYGWNFRF